MNPTGNHSGDSSRFADLYLARYSSGQAAELPQPDPDLFLTVVIPSYKEPELTSSLQSLLGCDPPGVQWEIIVVVNYPAGAPQEIVDLSLKNMEEIALLAINGSRDDVAIHAIWSPDLPLKHAGVGLARKIGMDEAIRRFNKTGNKRGILVGFDADSTCSTDFLAGIVRFYRNHPKARAANHYFEHPLDGQLKPEIYRAISEYELYLRYLRFALEYAGHPHAIHTVGSSFSVTAETYVRVNGMSSHSAGEDFYFLHKCAALERFYEINTISVFPSPRESDRVIFGTGATILKQSGDVRELEVYDIEAFQPLKIFFEELPYLYSKAKCGQELLDFSSWQGPLAVFLESAHAGGKIISLVNQTSDFKTFRKRFFSWFNGFMVLRYLNFYHIRNPKKGILESSAKLAAILEWPSADTTNSMLRIYRSAEKKRGDRRVI